MLMLCANIPENRLKRIKGLTSEVTSREMLRSLSQAKKECWDRFLHDAQTSELFQNGGDMDEGYVGNLKVKVFYLSSAQYNTRS